MYNEKNDNHTLDLHNFKATSWVVFESELFQIIDSFIYSKIKTKKATKLKIIVGKGIRSTKLINNKNPLRFYTEKYLQMSGLSWADASEVDGGMGVIIVWVNKT